jgi:epoxyqueuosine reductase
MLSLEQQLKNQAKSLGFDLVGIAAAAQADTFADFKSWLDEGCGGAMDYLERHAEARRHPDSILAGVHSVVMVAMNYKQPENPARPEIAQYARGRDYHDVLRQRLKELLAWLQEKVPDCRGRAVVDTAPLLERDFARRAGLGWFGKNTMLLNTQLGSLFFLGALLLDVELEPDQPFQTSHCGTCTACLEACPTQAFPEAGKLDARRCISYLTIELRGDIPLELRDGMGNWVFGCDVCQDVCPWNHKAPTTAEASFIGPANMPDLVELLQLSDEEFCRRFKGTALMRPRRSGLLRNAAIALANRGEVRALPALEALAQDLDPVLRETARWAIHKLAGRTAE